MQECSVIKGKCFASYLLLVYLLLNKKKTQGEHLLSVLILYFLPEVGSEKHKMLASFTVKLH